MEAVATSSELRADWQAFLMCFEAGLKKSRRRFWRPLRDELEPWHRQLIEQFRSQATTLELMNAWERSERESRSPGGEVVPATLLRVELRGVTQMLAAATDTRLPPSPAPPSMPPRSRGLGHKLKRLLMKPASLIDSLKAGGTLMESLKDILEHLPDWAKALLTIGKEAFDTAAG
jgi:hypothetical protein